MPLKAAIYIRVASTSGSVGIESQKHLIASVASNHNYEIAEHIIETAKGFNTLNREGIKQILALAESGIITRVYVANPDRISRNMDELYSFLNQMKVYHVSVYSCIDNANQGLK